MIKTAAIILASLILMIPAFLNGFPFVYPDTGAYIFAGMDLINLWDRPPTYGYFLRFASLGSSLWFVAFFQALVVALIIFYTYQSLRADAPGLGWYLCLMIILSVLTSLPWTSTILIPDISASLIVLLLYLWVYPIKRLSEAERYFFLSMVLFVASTHYSNLPLMAGLIVVALVLKLLATGKPVALKRYAWESILLLVLLSSYFAIIGSVKTGSMTLSPMGPVFFSARLVSEGLADDWLSEACPDKPTPWCEALELDEVNFDWIVWSQSSFLKSYNNDFITMIRDARQLSKGVLGSEAGGFVRNSIEHSVEQFFRFRSFDFQCPAACGPGQAIDDAIGLHFPDDLEKMRSSDQMTTGFVQSMGPIHRITAAISLLMICLLSFIAGSNEIIEN